MKIAIIGFSGAGKSTLARKLASYYKIDVLHLDAVHFQENWVERPDEEMHEIVSSFLSTHKEWIIEGNYLRICPERFLEADVVIDLRYNRFTCLRSVIRRYRIYKHKTRPDIAQGCQEKLDLPFLFWVFSKGRTKAKKQKHRKIVLSAKQGYEFKNRRQLQNYLKELGVKNEVGM